MSVGAPSAQTLTVKDVPVDAFWSVSLYNKDGYYEKNPRDAYIVNDRNARQPERGGRGDWRAAAEYLGRFEDRQCRCRVCGEPL